MKYCHTITVSVFVKPEDATEDAEINKKILESMKGMISLDAAVEKEVLKTTTAEGFENRKITIHELHLHKESHTNAFINNLMNKLTADQKLFLSTDKENRLDQNLEFFIRLEKTKFLAGIYELTTSGNCIHIRMNIAAFPKKRESALKVIDDMLKQ